MQPPPDRCPRHACKIPCEACAAALSIAAQTPLQRTREALQSRVHGTVESYRNGCGCHRCRVWARASYVEFRRRTEEGEARD